MIVLVLAVVLAGTAVAVGYNMFDWWKPPRFRVEEPKETVQAEPDSSMQREESHQPSASSEEESSVPENSSASPSEAESFPEGPGVDPNTRPEKWDVDIEEAQKITGKSLVAADPADEEFLAYTLYVLVADLEDDTDEVLPYSLEYRYRQGEITIGVSEILHLGWDSLGPMQPQSYAGQQINVNDRYVDPEGRITGWLNELAFVPVDASPAAMRDEWSGDIGCGVKYFSQDAVIKLAPAAGINLSEKLSPAEKLKEVQKLMDVPGSPAEAIYRSIGVYLGHSLALYHHFYRFRHVLLLGRVMSGRGGDLILDTAKKVLAEEYPEIARQICPTLPDEKSRRVGQSVAAASLPELGR